MAPDLVEHWLFDMVYGLGGSEDAFLVPPRHAIRRVGRPQGQIETGTKYLQRFPRSHYGHSLYPNFNRPCNAPRSRTQTCFTRNPAPTFHFQRPEVCDPDASFPYTLALRSRPLWDGRFLPADEDARLS